MDNQNRGTKRKLEDTMASVRAWCQTHSEYMTISLSSPYGYRMHAFYSKNIQQKDINALEKKLWTAMQLMAEEFKDDAYKKIMDLLSRHDFNDGVSNFHHFLKACSDFNNLVDSWKKSRTLQAGTASRPVLRFILETSYSEAIDDPDIDHSYEPFGYETFEETVDMVEQLVELCHISDENTLVNLGSGMGSVVMTVAALTKCSYVYGIEMDKTANIRAKKMETLFRTLLKWFGKTCAPFKLMEGDFFSPSFQDTLRNAKTILVNNMGLSWRIERDLKKIFSEMPTGTRIIVTKPFVSSSPIITNCGLSTIDFIQKISPQFTSVWWINRNKAFFVYVVNNQTLMDLSKKTNGKLYIDGRTYDELVSNDSNFETQTPISPTLPSTIPETNLLVGNEPSTSRQSIQPNLQTAKFSLVKPTAIVKSVQWGPQRPPREDGEISSDDTLVELRGAFDPPEWAGIADYMTSDSD